MTSPVPRKELSKSYIYTDTWKEAKGGGNSIPYSWTGCDPHRVQCVSLPIHLWHPPTFFLSHRHHYTSAWWMGVIGSKEGMKRWGRGSFKRMSLMGVGTRATHLEEAAQVNLTCKGIVLEASLRSLLGYLSRSKFQNGF